ncbi:hypothetical protein HKCCE2091_21535 [Rhodobacterales bacterium HKCCE2091]|nr:hypothetical protein [Rhodobacterales bacterium HKCCE2091]
MSRLLPAEFRFVTSPAELETYLRRHFVRESLQGIAAGILPEQPIDYEEIGRKAQIAARVISLALHRQAGVDDKETAALEKSLADLGVPGAAEGSEG